MMEDISCGLESRPIPCEQCRNSPQDPFPIEFRYVRRSIPGPGCVREEFEEQLRGCDCPQGCCHPDTCACLAQFGLSYHPLTGHLTREAVGSPSLKPVLECNSQCACDATCPNRLVQHGPRVKLKVAPAGARGSGLFACEDIAQLTFVCEYAGEVIGCDEARRRMERKDGGMNYLIVLREHCHTGVVLTCVDPEHVGNVGRFANHSCDPNLVMVPVRVDNSVPRLALFARRHIGAGEELTFDYSGDSVVGGVSTSDVCPTAEQNPVNKCDRDSILCVQCGRDISLKVEASEGNVAVRKNDCKQEALSCGDSAMGGVSTTDECSTAEQNPVDERGSASCVQCGEDISLNSDGNVAVRKNDSKQGAVKSCGSDVGGEESTLQVCPAAQQNPVDNHESALCTQCSKNIIVKAGGNVAVQKDSTHYMQGAVRSGGRCLDGVESTSAVCPTMEQIPVDKCESTRCTHCSKDISVKVCGDDAVQKDSNDYMQGAVRSCDSELGAADCHCASANTSMMAEPQMSDKCSSLNVSNKCEKSNASFSQDFTGLACKRKRKRTHGEVEVCSNDGKLPCIKALHLVGSETDLNQTLLKTCLCGTARCKGYLPFDPQIFKSS
ncbi:uncharacterized protein LOC143299534 [Babylonia areolata]|uniref:uncharacterized protein LOC143299534 n=1 Tax=Babylonia areolata TaxID=304850 RepID=UPI003FD2868E